MTTTPVEPDYLCPRCAGDDYQVTGRLGTISCCACGRSDRVVPFPQCAALIARAGHVHRCELQGCHEGAHRTGSCETTETVDPARELADYRRGWNTSRRAATGALDRADARGERDAWYRGYLDFVSTRPKYDNLDNHR